MRSGRLICWFFVVLAGGLYAQSKEKEYNDGHGGKIILPMGDLSFADKLISYKTGTPAPIRENANGRDALGKPNFNQEYVSGFVSL